jgi:hypothetical protein
MIQPNRYHVRKQGILEKFNRLSQNKNHALVSLSVQHYIDDGLSHCTFLKRENECMNGSQSSLGDVFVETTYYITVYYFVRTASLVWIK